MSAQTDEEIRTDLLGLVAGLIKTEMSDGIKVDYAEIDRLTTGITALNTFAGPLVPKSGALHRRGPPRVGDPLTRHSALAAEGAVINASAQLSVTIVSTKALVIITASISKVYEAPKQVSPQRSQA